MVPKIYRDLSALDGLNTMKGCCMLAVGCLCMQLDFVPFCGRRNVLSRLCTCNLVPADPLIYKQVRYYNIYNIIWLADFQSKFYIRKGVIHFYFFIRVGHLFYNFLQWGSLTFLESF